MVNGFQYYRALESVSIVSASALSTALTIYPCQIRVHQRWQSKLQLPTARKEWRTATADSSPQAVTCQHCDTHYFSRPRTRNLPIVGWLLVWRATSSATDSRATWICRSVEKHLAANYSCWNRWAHIGHLSVSVAMNCSWSDTVRALCCTHTCLCRCNLLLYAWDTGAELNDQAAFLLHD